MQRLILFKLNNFHFSKIYTFKSSLGRNYSKILRFKDIKPEHFSQVGEKNEILSKIYNLQSFIKIPNGFCLTKEVCLDFLYNSELPTTTSNVKDLVSSMKSQDELKSFINEKIQKTQFSKFITETIQQNYQDLERQYGNHCPIVIRSNVSEEYDFEPFYNIRDTNEIMENLKSKISEIYYYVSKETFHSRTISEKIFHNISLTLQKMIESNEFVPSGVMYNVDFRTGFRNAIEILSNFGYCEEILDSDHYVCFKPNVEKDIFPIIEKSRGEKFYRSILERNGKNLHKIRNSTPIKSKYCLTDEEIIFLSKHAISIEKMVEGNNVELKIKWAKDAKTKDIYIINVKEMKKISRLSNENWITEYDLLDKNQKEILIGDSINDRIVSGKVLNIKKMDNFKPGRILVTNSTNHQWNQALKRSKGLITENDQKFSHGPLFTKSQGIPCIFGAQKATQILRNGQTITMDGNTGKVYSGKLDFKISQHDLILMPKTQTKIMMKMERPEEAFKYSFVPNSGVGMLKIDTILKRIGIHPMSILHPYRLQKRDQIKLNQMTMQYPEKKEFFVEKLSNGISSICAAFYPKPVVVSFSDMMTSEYSNLLGGETFEPKERNPVLGLRGARRYLSDSYKEAFTLECEAIKRVREKMKFDNIQLIIPMCRTVEMGKLILEELKTNELEKNENLKIFLICELPSHIFQLDQFLELFDGYSIGTNDLTQMILGIDKAIKWEMISKIYDEKNSVIKNIIANTIEKVLKKKKYINICGDAVSEYPDFTEFLIENEIDAVTINPNSMIKSIHLIHEKETLISRIFAKKPEIFSSG
eukprot:gene3743-6631_t